MHPLSLGAPRSRASSVACLISLGWIAASCGSDTTIVGYCAAPRSLAVVVTVRDSISGDAAADGALGVLTGASVEDTLINSDALTLLGGDKTGTYAVTIDKLGYLTWSASNIHVTKVARCGNVIPVDLSAKLQPAPP